MSSFAGERGASQVQEYELEARAEPRALDRLWLVFVIASIVGGENVRRLLAAAVL